MCTEIDQDLNIFFNKYKNMFLGIKSLNDGYDIINKLSLDNTKKHLLMNYINSKKYEKVLSLTDMFTYIKHCNNIKYKEDVYKEITDIIKKTNDIQQIKTFTRIANSKISKPEYINLRDDNKNKKIITTIKNCPHCNLNYESDINDNLNYAICGYKKNNGFDLEGCQMDWCFKCGKKLCKSWVDDQLWMEDNRFHDAECCKKHALLNKIKYPDDYCMCKNINVNRDIVVSPII